MTTTKYYCQKCEKELRANQKPCPFCGCKNRDIKVCISETLKIRESLKGRQKRAGFKKFMIEFLQGWFPSKDKKKFPEGTERTRVIDKEKNRYQERVKNIKTGKITRNIEESLSQHKN